jgi:hypothetical protein
MAFLFLLRKDQCRKPEGAIRAAEPRREVVRIFRGVALPDEMAARSSSVTVTVID